MRAHFIVLAVMALAACTPEPEKPSQPELAICGGLEGQSCGAGEYCAYAQTGFCGAADQTGVCMPRPQACTMEYNPVCGCDDETYSSPCVAAAAGTSVAYLGECQR